MRAVLLHRAQRKEHHGAAGARQPGRLEMGALGEADHCALPGRGAP
jgi:hypothetical protein